jgi:hypothetical protein
VGIRRAQRGHRCGDETGVAIARALEILRASLPSPTRLHRLRGSGTNQPGRWMSPHALGGLERTSPSNCSSMNGRVPPTTSCCRLRGSSRVLCMMAMVAHEETRQREAQAPARRYSCTM